MNQSIENLSENEKKFLQSILEDGSKTDSDIADDIGVSKSTANRIRRKFEDEGVIRDYIPIVDLEEIGIDLYSIISFQTQSEVDIDDLKSNSNIIFLGETGDFNKSVVLFAGFSSYEEYQEFLDDLRQEHKEKLSDFNSNLISAENIHKEDFTHLILSTLQSQLKGET